MVFARVSTKFNHDKRSITLQWNKAGRKVSKNGELLDGAPFMAILTQITEGEGRAKKSYGVVPGGPSSADLGWMTESYLKEWESGLE